MNLNEINQIGIVGGGSSAIMLALEAAKKGVHTTLLDPKVDCVGAKIATEHMVAAITNESIEKLSLRTDVVVFNTNLDFELTSKLHSPTYPDRQIMDRLCGKKDMLDLLEALQIPVPKVYYQDNKAETFDKLEDLSFPFRFIKQYKDRSESVDVFDVEDVADFILEEETAESFMIQPITSYSRTIACLCIIDKKGKQFLYAPLEEKYEEAALCTVKLAGELSKTTLQKIGRYNKKLLKEIGGPGVFTIKYGVKANKGIEFLEMTPEIALSGILTLDAYDMSVYEQYMHMILDMGVVQPTLIQNVYGTIKDTNPRGLSGAPYHFYHLGVSRLCVTLDDE